MSVLSAQSIRLLCEQPIPLITPFTERGVVNGKSYGLSACTYDCRIDQFLRLEPIKLMTAYIGNKIFDEVFYGYQALASTMERFALPHNVCGSVLDKSTYARVFVSAFNTHLDPGWEGFLTVELVNLGLEPVVYNKGDPVCQIKFEWLDMPTQLPYTNRKYSDQPARPIPALIETGC